MQKHNEILYILIFNFCNNIGLNVYLIDKVYSSIYKTKIR